MNGQFLKGLVAKYGDPKIGPVKAMRAKRHDYLAMVLDYSTPKRVDMTTYVKIMVDNSLIQWRACPWNAHFFAADPKSPPLSKERAEQLRTFVGNALFVCRRALQDIQPSQGADC